MTMPDFISEDESNTFPFGKVIYGKSSAFETTTRQDIESGTGFFFIDPYKQAATNLIASIPSEKHDKIIHISPFATDVSAGGIRLNPVELKRPGDGFLVVNSFLHTLKNYYSSDGRIGWGPRLEKILRHALHLLVSKPGTTLKDLPQILINEKIRKEFIAICTHPATLEFFEKYWNDLPDEGKTAASNRVDAMLETPEIETLFDTAYSTVPLSDMVSKGMFVIMDLDGRVPSYLANLVASIIIHMFKVEGKSQHMRSLKSNMDFNIYVVNGHPSSP